MARVESIEAGDVVQLRSGGPEMTVVDVDGDTVTCHWYNGKNMDGGVFAPVVLKVIKKGE